MFNNKNQSQKATWRLALFTFLWPILGVFAFRWIFLEPFVIPSGSMIPTLLVHDHIFVNKLSYGIHWPFSNRWLAQWNTVKRNEIAVFKYPKNPNVFYVKRVVAIAGDEVEVKKGLLWINNEPQVQLPNSSDWYTGEEEAHHEFEYFLENSHPVRYYAQNREDSYFHKVTVPKGHFFVMGDNRDQSSDSRFWGFVPEDYLVGRAALIWLSCDKTLPSAPFICDPQTIRFFRMLKQVD